MNELKRVREKWIKAYEKNTSWLLAALRKKRTSVYYEAHKLQESEWKEIKEKKIEEKKRKFDEVMGIKTNELKKKKWKDEREINTISMNNIFLNKEIFIFNFNFSIKYNLGFAFSKKQLHISEFRICIHTWPSSNLIEIIVRLNNAY